MPIVEPSSPSPTLLSRGLCLLLLVVAITGRRTLVGCVAYLDREVRALLAATILLMISVSSVHMQLGFMLKFTKI